jgi:hypothetical protein
MSVQENDLVDTLPAGYVNDGGSSNWWQFFAGNPSTTANAGAAISCLVPPAPNSSAFGGIGVVPDDDKSTTIYFHCGLSTKTYGGRTTKFDSLETDKCKAWVQVALPNWGGVDVVEGNARFQIPTTKSGIAKKSRFDASAGLIVPITWNGSQTQSQYTPVVLKQSDLLVQGTDQVVKSIEWRPYMPKTVEENGTSTDWEYGFCRFKAETNSVISEVAMGFSDSDSTGGELSGPSAATMYPTASGLGLYPSQTPAISVISNALPEMSVQSQNANPGGVDIYKQIAMPLVGGDPNQEPAPTFSLSSMNGAWYLKKGSNLDGTNSYDQVKIGYLDASNNNISTLGGAYPIPVTENTLTITYTRSGEPNQRTFFWEGQEELVALNSVGDVSYGIMDLSAGATQECFWGNSPPFKFGIRCKDGVYQIDSATNTSNVSGLTNSFPVLDISFGLADTQSNGILSVTGSPAMVRMDISSQLWVTDPAYVPLVVVDPTATAATFINVEERPGDRPIPSGLHPSMNPPTNVSLGRQNSFYFTSPIIGLSAELSSSYRYVIQGTDPSNTTTTTPFTSAYPFMVKGTLPDPAWIPYTDIIDASYARFVSWTPSGGPAPTVDISGASGASASKLIIDIPYGITDCSLAFGLGVLPQN